MTNTVIVNSRTGVTYTYSEPVLLVTSECARCGILFGLPKTVDDSLRLSGEGFFCPHGHSLTYGDTERKRITAEREKFEQRLASAREDERIAWSMANERRLQVEAERRRHAATKGQLTKTRKRAAAAICPVDGCHRQIVQMQRHLAAKHHGFEGITHPKDDRSGLLHE